MNTYSDPLPNSLVEFQLVSYAPPRQAESLILHDISLSVHQGETVVLLGKSGSGKTTLLKLVNRLLSPTKGIVAVQGRATSDWDPIRLRRGIGYVIQEVGLFPHLSVFRNVTLVPELERWADERSKRRFEEVMTLVGLDPGSLADRRPHELSGGQRQRIGVARALAADPPILLMDEPFGALDPVTRADLQLEFRDLAKRLQKTILLVTHDLREALLLGSRILLVDEGRIVADSSAADFARLPDPQVRGYIAASQINGGAA